MKTDDLIAMLGTNVESVSRGQLARTIGASVLLGAGGAFGIMLLAFGIRPDLNQSWRFLLLKVFFTLGLTVLASIYLFRVARPDTGRKIPAAVLASPFVAIMLLAAISLAAAPVAHWNSMVAGEQWLECLVSIPVIAVVPFAVIIWAVRRMAPTDLVRAGGLAGLVAGGVSAIGYALHCMDDSLPFIALWYSASIVLCTIAGAKLGPRLLRW